MLLSTDDTSDYLQHAQHAVDLLQEWRDPQAPTSFPRKQYAEAQRLLAQAKLHDAAEDVGEEEAEKPRVSAADRLAIEEALAFVSQSSSRRPTKIIDGQPTPGSTKPA